MAAADPITAARLRPSRLARMLGITRQSLHELIERGIIEKGADGLVDVELAKVAIARRMHPGAKTAQAVGQGAAPPAGDSDAGGAGDAGGDGSGMDWQTARTMREVANAQIDQLRLRKLRGKLTEVESVSRGIFAISRMLRDMVLNVPKRVAAEAVASGDARVAERLMTEGLRRAFEDFTKLAKDEVQRAALRSQADEAGE